ncbi:unnamed protein product [Nyctereutes procyonoides]|uniref:(raccoon dog) hypothetical protein n=1 Tax=Nyctereutes procyonoides TaxID=34880 RepID=A0A811Y7D6_NYCPR|nr:unnamed protein product [Nyctereutes procyonoides]
MSAQVSGCAGGSGVSEALALPQSPPCNPDPRERARERGRGLREPRPLASQAHSTGSPAPARPRALARAGISNAGDWARRAAGAAGEARGLASRLGWAALGAGGWGLAGRWAQGPSLPCLGPSATAQSDQTPWGPFFVQEPRDGLGTRKAGPEDGLARRQQPKYKANAVRGQMLRGSLILPEDTEEGF